jgi:hypothetical protein
MARATSMGCPNRPIGWRASSQVCSSDHWLGSWGSPPSKGVSIVPGEIAFTRIPRLAGIRRPSIVPGVIR